MKDKIQEFIYLDAITKTMEEDRKFNQNTHNQLKVVQQQIVDVAKKNKRLKLLITISLILNICSLVLIGLLLVK